VTVTTSNGGGTSATSSADKFTYIAVPTVTSISPSSGPLAGGTSVTITGTNFTGTTGVNFGSNNALGFTVNSATQITATSPANSAGTVDITVTTTLGTNTNSSADKFTYVAAPTVTGISPSSGSTTGGTGVTITGTHFTGATGVKFGSNNATNISIISDISITVTAPVGSLGAVNVTVTTPGGNGTLTGGYTYVTPTAAGPNNARTGADGGGSGSSWSSPGNITADDTSYATYSLSSHGGSHYLNGTNYGFNIQAGATITGIQVTIMRQSSSSNSLTDNVVQLLKGGNRVGSDYSSSTSWPTSMTAASYGGSSDLWGTTWTVNDINATNFGVALSVSNGSFSGRTASVDYMQITVYYTP
jgi:hypothetical protein